MEVTDERREREEHLLACSLVYHTYSCSQCVILQSILGTLADTLINVSLSVLLLRRRVACEQLGTNLRACDQMHLCIRDKREHASVKMSSQS